MKRVFVVVWLLQFAMIAAPADAKPVKRHPGNRAGTGYLVLVTPEMASGVTGLAPSLAATYNLRVGAIWEHIGGFYCEGSLEAASLLANDPRVEVVEEDHKFYAPMVSAGTTVALNDEDSNLDDLWYLDRLDEVSWETTPRDHDYNMCTTGANTVAYVLDWGVWKAHKAFEISPGVSRVTRTIDCSEGDSSPKCIEQDAAEKCKQYAADSNDPSLFWYASHGTAVASLLTGATTGAARPEIISINLFRCAAATDVKKDSYTTASKVVAALDWIKSNIQWRKANEVPYKRSIVNHSGFIYPWSTETDVVRRAVEQVVWENVPYFTSADNFSGDSCQFWPNQKAYTPSSRHWSRPVFVVGGTTMDGGVSNNRMTGTKDVLWRDAVPATNHPQRIQDTGTNLGACVSAFAPAVHIHTAMHTHPMDLSYKPDPTAYFTNRPGTSFAAPLAAAVALRWMAEQTTNPWYEQVYNFLLDGDKASVVTHNADGTPITNPSYTICYDPNNVNNWEYFPDPNKTCTVSLTVHTQCDPTHGNYNPEDPDPFCFRTEKWLMPSASASSGARMIHYPGCP